MMIKYKFTGETMEFDGHTLHRIVAVNDILGISEGELGGWIESESNLSQGRTSCWVADEAKVYGNSEVRRAGRVSGNAIVKNGVVRGRAGVYQNAIVEGATISDSAIVGFSARVLGGKVKGHAIVTDNAVVYSGVVDGNSYVGGRTVIRKHK